MKYLLKNAKLLSGETACVVTDGAYITYVGAQPSEDSYDRIIDCTDRLLMPGLYNCHTHAAMTLFRGYGEDMPLDRWLHEKIFPAEDLLTSRAVYNASMLAIAEMIRGGTVSFSDMYFFCDDTARAVAESGIKANISRSITSFDPDIDMSRDRCFDEAKALYSEWNNAEDGRIKIDISLHAEYTNVPRACIEVGKYAAEHGANLHIHLSETESEHEQCKERHGGLTPAAFFEQCGCFEAPVTAAHCVWVEDGDIELLARHGATAIYIPVSNLKLGSGVMPLAKLLDGGVNVALGTDGTASNNVLDIFKEMHVGAIVQKGFTRDPSRIGAGDMLRAATVAGAHAQQRGDCGEIAVGRRADIILLDLGALNNIPYYDLRYTAVYSANSSNVTMTMVDGRILYEDGEFTTVDIEKIIHDMREECGNYFKDQKDKE